ncbi:MAG: hypothetical protein KGL39_06455 [Patescibacteria group bacterium]|nr:hypothetical protein [Patescibacteria group bacterium]
MDQTLIPADEPVLVELDPGEGKEPVVKPEPKKRAKAEEPKPEPQEPKKQDDGAAQLLAQLNASENARKAAERKAQEASEQLREAQARTASTEADLVQNGLTAAQAELNAAKQQLKSAGESGDWEALAEAQSKIGRAAADIRSYEREAAELAQRKESEAKRPVVPAQQEQTSVDVVTAIDQMQILPTEKSWLKEHPEVMLDPLRNKELETAYIRATRKGLSRGTTEYFNFLNDFMGFAKAALSEGENEPEERNSIVSAPVSREVQSVNGRPSSRTEVRLTPQQREMADLMGISYVEYAKGYLQMADDKAANPEKFQNRR